MDSTMTMTALGIFHTVCAAVLFAELADRPTKMKAVTVLFHFVYAAIHLSKVLS